MYYYVDMQSTPHMESTMKTHHEIISVGNKVEAERDGAPILVGFVAKIEDRPFALDYLVRRDPAEQGFWFTRDELSRV